MLTERSPFVRGIRGELVIVAHGSKTRSQHSRPDLAPQGYIRPRRIALADGSA